jgi:hypothetical protein
LLGDLTARRIVGPSSPIDWRSGRARPRVDGDVVASTNNPKAKMRTDNLPTMIARDEQRTQHARERVGDSLGAMARRQQLCAVTDPKDEYTVA